MDGIVFDIKRYAVHDGPGIRTTIFLKGCPLRCIWCHNPESFSAKEEEFELPEQLGDVSLMRKKQIGQTYSKQELIKEIEKDILFFDESEGGVTFSGGEPLMQIDFLEEMLKECKAKDIHTVVDTSGLAALDHLKRIIDNVDLFLFDVKHMKDEEHKKLTCVSNKQILENLDHLMQLQQPLIIRYPMIPDCNDSKVNINEMINFLKQYDWKPEVHILPYHRIGKDKYDRFNKENHMPDIPSLKEEDCEWAKAQFEQEGFKVCIGG